MPNVPTCRTAWAERAASTRAGGSHPAGLYRRGTGLCTAIWLLLAVWLTIFASTAQAVEAEAPDTTQSAAQQTCAGEPGLAVMLEVDGAIGPATTEYLERGLAQALERDARVVIIRIDTPGGLVTSLREINRAILASPIPVISYVGPSGAQAASAGTYMVYASHLAAMAPGTNLGAATPVAMGGAPGQPPGTPQDDASPDGNENENESGDTSRERDRSAPGGASDPGSQKAINDAVAYIRSLAELHGRNADWAEEAVREAASLSAREALANNVVEIVATDIEDLLEQAHGREVQLGKQTVVLDTRQLQVEIIEPDWRAQFLSVITNPNLAYILLLIGIYGIIFELMNPGAIVPGTIGGISLLTAMLALNMLPINYAGGGLMLLGIALMTAEAFVSSFGILGLAGLAAFALGSVLLFDGDIPGMGIDWPVIAAAGLSSLILLGVILASVVRAHRRQVVSGDATVVGQTGIVERWQGTQGTVHVHGESWSAQGPEGLLPGQMVTVVKRDGLSLQVDAAASAPPPS